MINLLCRYFTPVDIIAVVRHNKTLKRRHYQTEAVRGNFFLRGFNYLFIMKKEAHAAQPAVKLPSHSRAARPGAEKRGANSQTPRPKGPRKGR